MPTLFVVDFVGESSLAVQEGLGGEAVEEGQNDYYYWFIEVLHCFLNLLPAWEELSIQCGDFDDSTMLLFNNSKPSIIAGFAQKSIRNLDKFQLDLAAVFPPKDSFALTIVLFSNNPDRSPVTYTRGLASHLLGNFRLFKIPLYSSIQQLNDQSTGVIKRDLSLFVKRHYRYTLCFVSLGKIAIPFKFYPSVEIAIGSSMHVGDGGLIGELSFEWFVECVESAESFASLVKAKCIYAIELLKVQVEFCTDSCPFGSHNMPNMGENACVFGDDVMMGEKKSSMNEHVSVNLSAYLAQLVVTGGKVIILRDQSGNKGSFQKGSKGGEVLFILHSYYGEDCAESAIESRQLLSTGKTDSIDTIEQSPKSYNLMLATNRQQHIPFYNEDIMAELIERFLTSARLNDEQKFLVSLSRFELLVRVYKNDILINQVEEELLMNGADAKFVDLINDLRSKI